MKRFLSLTAIFAVMMVAFTGCEKTPKPDPTKTNLTLSVPAPAFKFDAETAFTVTASAPVAADVTVNLTSSNPAAATVPASVVIKAGTDKAEGKITGVAEGKSTIKIEAADVEYTVQSVDVTVTQDTPPTPAKIDVAISTTHAEVAPAAKISFKVTAAKAVETEALVINVASSNAAAATVPATVTIPVGETSVSGEITGVAAGEANITISSDKINATVGSVAVTVKEGAATAVALSLSTAANEMEVGDKLKFTITSPVAPEAALTINLSSSTANATVPATIVLPAGAMSVSGDITGALIGDAKISIAAAGTTITKADVDVTITERTNISYCQLNFLTPTYAVMNYFKLGDTNVACGENTMYTGSGPLANTFELELDGMNADYPMDYDGDVYTIAIFADWNKSGAFVKVHSQDFELKLPTTKITGTFEIPASISSKSVIRAICYFTGERNGSNISNEGCGKMESGTAVDFTYTKQ